MDSLWVLLVGMQDSVVVGTTVVDSGISSGLLIVVVVVDEAEPDDDEVEFLPPTVAPTTPIITGGVCGFIVDSFSHSGCRNDEYDRVALL